MNRRFRLATLERLRAAQLDEAGTQLQAAAQVLADAVRKRDELTRALRQATNPDAAPPHEFTTRAVHRERLREERAAAAAEVDVRAEELATAREAWLEARAQLRAVQSLHERHRQALAAADARREQQAADEVAGNLATRRILAAGAGAA